MNRHASGCPPARRAPLWSKSWTKTAATERMSYWDTSALGKLYLPEADSPAFAQKAAQSSVRLTGRGFGV
jgi:hypothetical protein